MPAISTCTMPSCFKLIHEKNAMHNTIANKSVQSCNNLRLVHSYIFMQIILDIHFSIDIKISSTGQKYIIS